MYDFATEMQRAAEKALLKIVSEGRWIEPTYADRVRVPAEMLQEIWRMVDVEKIKAALARRLEVELADRILNHMAAEISTDVKQILSVTERREALRQVVRDNMDTILAASKEPVKR